MANTPKNILIPVDFSDHSRRALDYGVALAERVGGQATALHVLPPAFEYIPLEQAVWGATVTANQIRERVTENAQKEFAKFMENLPETVRSRVTQEMLSGEPSETVLDRAEQGNFDLIVVGSHGRRGVARWVMGSVAERIVRHARCPVLVVH